MGLRNEVRASKGAEQIQGQIIYLKQGNIKPAIQVLS